VITVKIPIAVRSFEIEWLRPDGTVDYVERAGVKRLAPGRWLVQHEVRGREVYREVYALHPRENEQVGTEVDALEDLNCLYREFWEPIASGEARLSKSVETSSRPVIATARSGLKRRGSCPVRVRTYWRRR